MRYSTSDCETGQDEVKKKSILNKLGFSMWVNS